ncbi:hypothetical protein WG66_006054 [Moniliophthora roreri]|nr:hypothetical protein WG66_006054 [Moniliophthora roreri]
MWICDELVILICSGLRVSEMVMVVGRQGASWRI